MKKELFEFIVFFTGSFIWSICATSNAAIREKRSQSNFGNKTQEIIGMSSDLANLENAELKEAFDAFDKVT